jgi:hypothetical protein
MSIGFGGGGISGTISIGGINPTNTKKKTARKGTEKIEEGLRDLSLGLFKKPSKKGK